MDPHASLALSHHFRDLPDPRRSYLCRHRLLDLVAIAVCAALCGQHSWSAIQLYAETHADWLGTFLELPGGIPSHDAFRYLFTRLDPEAFQRCFAGWIAALSRATDRGQIAIDGKTLRGTIERAAGKAGLHLVSAWAVENQLTLAQVAVAEKSNEVTAVPRLLRLLQLQGAIVTIDAMGCQKEIARQIHEAGGDYVLAVKDNQPRLAADVREAVAAHFDAAVGTPGQYHEAVEVGHGRKELRTYTVVTDLSQIRDREQWPGLGAVCLVYTEREAGAEVSQELRYYVGSFRGTAWAYADLIRGHWGIENNCHWVLDVTFGEDGSRARSGHGAENLAWLRRMAVSLLKNDTTCRRSLREKSIKALCDNKFLLQLLTQVRG